MITSPVAIFSIEFRDGIPLHDPATDKPVNDGPHWIRDARNKPAAYVCGTNDITLEVVFLETYEDNLNVVLKTVYASGSRGGVGETPLTIGFDSASGLSGPVSVRLADPLPDGIGVHEYSFHWYVTDEAGHTFDIGSTTHTLYTTWKPMPQVSENPGRPLNEPVYEPVMRWSCQWTTGLQDGKAICDALIKHLHSSGLIYGLQGNSQTVRSLLLRGGGLCGAWCRFFQQLAYCQGVQVCWRDMTIVAEERKGDRLWDGAVAIAGGVNQPYPDVDPHRFVEASRLPSPLGPPAIIVETVEARRYVYGGETHALVGIGPSTHAVNFFIDDDGHVYLYDPSFADGPYPFQGPVPKPGTFMTGEAIEDFKNTYLNKRFPYLMGSIRNGDAFYETDWAASPPKYGLLVKIDLISPDDITIGWSVNS